MEAKFDKKPERCADCKYCDFSVADPEWGDCLITDEELWDIFKEELPDKCPAKNMP